MINTSWLTSCQATGDLRKYQISMDIYSSVHSSSQNENADNAGNKLLKATILAKIFQTNCSFSVKQHPTGKVQFLFFKNFLLVLTKF